MFRRMLSSLVLLSALLCAALIVLWVRSYFSYETVGWVREGREGLTQRMLALSFTTFEGKLILSRDRTNILYGTPVDIPPANRFVYRETNLIGLMSPPHTNALGFGTESFQTVVGSRVDWYARFTAPFWLPVIIFGAGPGIWFWARAHRKHRIADGACEECGYDLRASPERCPECGTDVPDETVQRDQNITPSARSG
jgi:hypothetical protein